MIFRPPLPPIYNISGIIFKIGGIVKAESGHKKPRPKAGSDSVTLGLQSCQA